MTSDERLLQAINFLMDYSMGTIWRVDESIWQSKIRKYRSTRKWHPGLSLSQASATYIHDTIPMLQGTSVKHNSEALTVHGLTEERGSLYPTYFGRILRPVRIEIIKSIGKNPLIEPNSYKRAVNAEEMEQLKKMLAQRGVRS